MLNPGSRARSWASAAAAWSVEEEPGPVEGQGTASGEGQCRRCGSCVRVAAEGRLDLCLCARKPKVNCFSVEARQGEENE